METPVRDRNGVCTAKRTVNLCTGKAFSFHKREEIGKGVGFPTRFREVDLLASCSSMTSEPTKLPGSFRRRFAITH